MMTQIFYYAPDAWSNTFITKKSLTGPHTFGYSLYKTDFNMRDFNIYFFFAYRFQWAVIVNVG